MAKTMMKLGDYIFSVQTAAYQQLSRNTAYRWKGIERYGEHSTMQYTGPGKDTITLPGVIYPEFRGGLGQLEAMREEAGKGEPLQLTDNRGGVHGKWCITSINETQTTFFHDGAPRKISFSLQLTYAGATPRKQKFLHGR